VVLDGGSITESGSHDELMARGGKYAQMFLTQADRFNRRDNDQRSEAELV
jgi:ABC-type transport system involved in cytochrome bd biosynthesis fused ATPase/permease subunit